jgi:excisionase family DNA binding protein
MQTTSTDEARVRAGYAGNRGRSLGQAAEIIGCSQRTLERRIRDGEIRAVRISPRRVVITDREIDRVLSGAAAQTNASAA